MSIQIRIITAILCLWSGLFAFLPVRTATAAVYGAAGDQFPNVLSGAQIAVLTEQKIEETLAGVGETRRHDGL